MELSELIGQAQTLMDDGAYTRASVLCEHGLAHYPACLTLQRMLGECLLEQRFVDKAIERFQAALNVDPLSVLGRLGMGVAAEEKQDFEAAYACYLHAWEINPALQHVRDRLVKLRQMLGVDPRLHLTRAGLASVHLRAGQYERAIAELSALTLADPDARRIKTMLAEAHWRKGEDAAAAALSREGLEHSPENARYLGLLSEIELRQSSPAAADLVARYQAADPMGEIASLMMEWRADRDVSHLFRESAPLPEPAAAPVEVEQPVTLVMEPAKAAPEFTDTVATREPALAYSGGKVTAGLDKSIQPFVWDDSPSASAGSGGVWDDWSNPTPPVVNSAVEESPAAMTSAPSPSPFVTADGRLDLTVGWDDLDKALADATPQTGPLSNYTGLLSQLSVEGIAPFDASEVKGDESAWEPLFEPDGGTGLLGGPLIAASAPAAPVQPAPVPQPVVTPPRAVVAPAPVERAPVAAAPVATEDAIAPFSFEELDGGDSGGALPAHAFDNPAADFGATPRRQTSSLQKPVEAMASALDAMFSNDPDPDPRAVTAGSGPRPVERPGSVFDMLRASKTRPAPAEAASSAAPVPAMAARDDELPMTAILPSEVVENLAGPVDVDAEPKPADSLAAVAAELKAAMAGAGDAGARLETRIETSDLEAWVQANEPSTRDVNPAAEPKSVEIGAAEVAPVEFGAAPVAEVEPPSAELEPVADEPVAVAAAAPDFVPGPAEAAAEDVADAAMTGNGLLEVEGAAAEEVAAVVAVEPEADLVAPGGWFTEAAVEAESAVAVPAEEPGHEEAPVELVAEAESRAEPEAEPELVVASEPDTFHVKPAPVAALRSRRVVALDPEELTALRAQLISPEHGAPSVIAAVQDRLAGRAPDRAAARLLGEAYLRLGEPGQAAAHFRHAMLHRVRERAASGTSFAR